MMDILFNISMGRCFNMKTYHATSVNPVWIGQLAFSEKEGVCVRFKRARFENEESAVRLKR